MIAASIPAATLISDGIATWSALVGVLLILLSVELLNTAIEKLCDHVHPTWNPSIGLIKDLGSAAVLCILILALFIWSAAVINHFQKITE